MKKTNYSQLNYRIGAKIYEERIAQRISQETLSERANVSRVFISMLENGSRTASIDTYYRIACALNISLCELFREHNDNKAAEILLLLSNCSAGEVDAFIEILHVLKRQMHILIDR